MGATEINERFARRLARLASEGALVRLVDARFEDAREDFARATLARKLAPRSSKAQREFVRSFFAMKDAAKAVEAAR